MEDIGYYEVKVKLKRNEEIVEYKCSYSYKEKCHLIVFTTNFNRNLGLKIKEYLK